MEWYVAHHLLQNIIHQFVRALICSSPLRMIFVIVLFVWPSTMYVSQRCIAMNGGWPTTTTATTYSSNNVGSNNGNATDNNRDNSSSNNNNNNNTRNNNRNSNNNQQQQQQQQKQQRQPQQPTTRRCSNIKYYLVPGTKLPVHYVPATVYHGTYLYLAWYLVSCILVPWYVPVPGTTFFSFSSFFYFSSSCHSFFSLLRFLSSIECVCRPCPIQYDEHGIHCIIIIVYCAYS